MAVSDLCSGVSAAQSCSLCRVTEELEILSLAEQGC